MLTLHNGYDSDRPVRLKRPPHHKNSHRGHNRTILIGPKAREVLRQVFTLAPPDFLISPALTVEILIAAKTVNRKTPRYPFHTPK